MNEAALWPASSPSGPEGLAHTMAALKCMFQALRAG